MTDSLLPTVEAAPSWVYLYVHHNKLEMVNDMIGKH